MGVDSSTLKYPPHKLALIFPRPSAEEQDKLTDHIRRNGLQEPVILFEGKILDGVSRATSCARLGMNPRYCEFMNLSPDIKEAGPLAFVAGRNLIRRHLKPSQAAMVAAELIAVGKKMTSERTGMPIVIEEDGTAPKRGRGRPKGSGKLAATVAASMGVSARSVERASKLLKESPKKAAAVKEGTSTLGKETKDISAAEKKRIDRGWAIERIGKICGKPLAESVDRGSRLKTHKDLMEFVGQTDEEMKQQGGLIEMGWKLKKARLYRAKNLTRRHTIEDMMNRAASNQNELLVEIDNWRFEVVKINGAK